MTKVITMSINAKEIENLTQRIEVLETTIKLTEKLLVRQQEEIEVLQSGQAGTAYQHKGGQG